MALTRIHVGESGSVRIGDAVFSFRAGSRYPLHVGVARQSAATVGPGCSVRVIGLPDHPKGDFLGSALWGTAKQYQPSLVGQRLDAEEPALKAVAVLAEAVALEHSQLATECCWAEQFIVDEKRRVVAGAPLFISGTCAHFVEYLYEHSGLDLVDQATTCDPANPTRLPPATQVVAFWTGHYPLSISWDARLASYDECLKVANRTTTR